MSPDVTAAEPTLVVERLDVTFRDGVAGVRAVRDVSIAVRPGECLAVVGESGAGKSVLARTLIGLAGRGAMVRAGRLDLQGVDLTALTEPGWRVLRGRRIGLVPQDALASLDPLRTVGAEVAEPLRVHRIVARRDVRERAVATLGQVGVPEPARRAGQYPHQLSGGLRQRALIASTVAAGPDLLLVDEPTTALDAASRERIVEVLRGLVRGGVALLLISHDLATVAAVADRVAVMYEGRIIEQGPAVDVLGGPRHPYTCALLAAAPSRHSRGTVLSPDLPRRPPAGPDGCPYAVRCPLADHRCREELPRPDHPGLEPGVLCWRPGTETERAGPPRVVAPARRDTAEALVEATGITKRFRDPDGGWRDAVRAVTFELRAAETLGVIGGSGSGKTTLARIVLGLLEPDEGTVRFAGAPWVAAAAATASPSRVRERDRRPRRHRIQAVHQDCLSSFDPRHTAERIVGDAMSGPDRGRARRDRIVALLDQVGLSEQVLRRHPRELSGGQRQRLAIARALAPSPEVLVCDEPVSALDLSVQAQILDLLAGLRDELGLALLFISHDIAVIRHVSDRVLVMKDGQVAEIGGAEQVLERPAHPYTRHLLAAART
ncbi:peptide ABC transporter ATP-binding protein [Frankia sp. CcI156]|uniref:dipeptide ABC transporter ATP-binding protein n=1 Tax=Frankia TaxID=1854 RepID=UPI0003D00509|nr:MULTISPECIES: ABC transporter ATP-binding protein [Frankia]ETA00386.1 ATPase of ABC-type transport system [Frankia sp. CcI6]KDA41345.1 ATPase component of various ABC-type transport systems with duplicated ATPase domain [Frankia sp. BMG5.23]KFB04619.1 oligopeptide/dipeptide ABC transporter, ATP-binding protein [Frankia sp. Allo2]OAA20815.1 peptide/nickel transport system ATP-binding protein [Frankia casuarinae]OHV50633.1 peptide ABC transporter ATP-binding protein [Frankia sp. CgIS1]